MYEGKAEMQPTKQDLSPFENLNQTFEKQNDRLRALLDRLEGTGHRLSNTNVPQCEANKESMPETPFREGHLMQFFIQINRMESNLNRLNEEVGKIESLV